MQDYYLKFRCAPGDIVASTRFVSDLVRQRDVRVAYDTNWPDILAFNRNIVPRAELKNPTEFVLDYSTTLHEAKQNRYQGHFISAFHREWELLTRDKLSCLDSRPDVRLAPHEKAPVAGKYWLLLAGGKSDMTVKHWSFQWYEDLTRRLRAVGIKVVQTGAAGDIHPSAGADVDLVGIGDLRFFVKQVAFAAGVICPITCAMHLAAAFDKPCVVIAGGRENYNWGAYTNHGQFGPNATPLSVEHRYLHTIGKLNCCADGGCWRRKAIGTTSDCCVDQTREGFQILPRCMKMVTVDDVFQAVMSYER